MKNVIFKALIGNYITLPCVLNYSSNRSDHNKRLIIRYTQTKAGNVYYNIGYIYIINSAFIIDFSTIKS